MNRFIFGLAILLILYIWYRLKFFKMEEVEPVPIAQSEKHALVLFYAPWCGYCQQFIPEWHQVKEALVEHPYIEAIEINGDENSDLVQQYQIPGYPTILMELNNGQVVKYDGDRNAHGVLNFVQQF